MDRCVIVAIHCRAHFVWNKNWKLEYYDGRNKVRAINKTTAFRKLKDMVYEIIGIDYSIRMKMKFIFHSYYELIPIDIKNDNDIYYFVVE